MHPNLLIWTGRQSLEMVGKNVIAAYDHQSGFEGGRGKRVPLTMLAARILAFFWTTISLIVAPVAKSSSVCSSTQVASERKR